MTASPVLCNADELARLTGLSATTIRRQAKAGRLPHLYIGDRLLFVTHQVVEFLTAEAAQAVRPPEPKADKAPRRRARRIVQP